MGELQLDGYVRVSRIGGREGDSFISPDVQRDQIATWARLRGVTIAQWHTDLDVSGGTMSRPGLETLLARVRAGESGGIAVARLDRLSRASVVDALKVVEEIHDAGGQVAAVDLGIDPTTAFGEFAMTIMLALARMERRRIADQWRVSRQRAVERGVHVASGTPTGYDRGPDGVLVVKADDAKVVRRMFEMRAAGHSWSVIDEYLEGAGIEGPYGVLARGSRSARNIVINRVYLGEARSGEYVNAEAHEPIVDASLWDAANAARAAAASRGEPALLSGILRCAGCRHPLKPDRMTDRDGSRLRLYRCRGFHAAGRCENRTAVLGRVIEPYVFETLAAYFGDREQVAHRDSDELPEVEREIVEREAELNAFRDSDRILATLGEDRFVAGIEARMQSLSELYSRRTALLAALGLDGVTEAWLREQWPLMDVEQQRRVIAGAIDAVMLRGGRDLPLEHRTVVLWHGEMPSDFPRRGRRNAGITPFAWPS